MVQIMERRKAHRYKLCYPITVRVSAFGKVSTFKGQTWDISTKGIRFSARCPVALQATIEFTIGLPAMLPGGGDAILHGDGRILWADKDGGGNMAIAIAIQRYAISRAVGEEDPRVLVDAL
jgi:PilZ domain